MREKESSSHWWIAIVVVALLLGGLYYWKAGQAPQSAPAPAAVAPPPATAAEADVPTAGPEPVPALPAAPQYPIGPDAAAGVAGAEEGTAPAAGAKALPGTARAAEGYFSTELGKLPGAAALRKWLQLDDFARRVVAFVDNLPGRHVAPLVWPVQPTPGQLAIEEREGQSSLGAANAARYRPLVQAFEAVDTRAAVALYRSSYPLFQKAYEDLGYPGRYFNDRLVYVIDHLLATPDLPDPIAVVLPQVKPAEGATEGGTPFLQPWVRYEFADPTLEKLSAGQKIMLRMGAANRTAVKAKLREWRAAITQ